MALSSCCGVEARLEEKDTERFPRKAVAAAGEFLLSEGEGLLLREASSSVAAITTERDCFFFMALGGRPVVGAATMGAKALSEGAAGDSSVRISLNSLENGALEVVVKVVVIVVVIFILSAVLGTDGSSIAIFAMIDTSSSCDWCTSSVVTPGCSAESHIVSS
jgi:hypothetical protein